VQCRSSLNHCRKIKSRCAAQQPINPDIKPTDPDITFTNLHLMIFVSNQFSRRSSAIGGGPGCLILGILGLVALWFILKGLYMLLYWIAPVLFVLALVVNWRAVADTGREFWGLLQRNPLGGLMLGAFCVLAFPLLTLYLFFRALGYNKVQELKRQFGQDTQGPQPEGDFADYEELESQPKSRRPAAGEEPMDIPLAPDPEPAPPPAKAEAKKPGNPYDQMFED
jgi:hypothetical protein